MRAKKLGHAADTGDAIEKLDLRELEIDEFWEGAQLLGRGMRDNPNNVRTFGADRARRERALARMFLPLLRRARTKGKAFGAFDEAKIVGVYVISAPGRCQLNWCEKIRHSPSILFGNSLLTPPRVLRWTNEWARRDPKESHWHLGPLAVDSHLRGQGIGSALMDAFCAQMDEYRMFSYLETDKAENVGFYQRFGFRVVSEGNVLGVPNWFMARPARIS
jgi:ribosomal protein S18 acetylase RimI-like enzyme